MKLAKLIRHLYCSGRAMLGSSAEIGTNLSEHLGQVARPPRMNFITHFTFQFDWTIDAERGKFLLSILFVEL